VIARNKAVMMSKHHSWNMWKKKTDMWTSVDLHDERSMRVLASDLSCTVGELRSAVQRVGPTIADVRNYVARSRALGTRWTAARSQQDK
jgi:hypothetical protein